MSIIDTATATKRDLFYGWCGGCLIPPVLACGIRGSWINAPNTIHFIPPCVSAPTSDDINGFILAAAVKQNLIPPILHYSAPEPYTKFEICLVFSKLLGVPITHITPDADEPMGAAAVSRPRDTQLYTRETEDLMGGNGGLGTTGFEEWWAEYLGADKG